MAVTVDVSSLSYFLPILAFLIVTIVVFAVLQKIKIIEAPWLQIFVSLFVAAIFVSSAASRLFVINIIPLFAVLIVSFFLLMALTGFVGGMDGFNKGAGKGFAIAMLVVFLVVFFVVFSSYIGPYLPGSNGAGADAEAFKFLSWLYSGRVAGAIILIVVSAVVAWVLVKAKK